MDQSLYDLAAVAERELQAVSGFGANVSVNSASGVIARNLSNGVERLGFGGQDGTGRVAYVRLEW